MKTTIEQFIRTTSNLSETLIRDTITALGGWDRFHAAAHDLVFDSRFRGFGSDFTITPADFARQHLTEIRGQVHEGAECCGESPASVVRQCLYLAGYHVSDAVIYHALYLGEDDSDLVMNALAWIAIENVAYGYADWLA